jgi:FkbM family methyltransferase
MQKKIYTNKNIEIKKMQMVNKIKNNLKNKKIKDDLEREKIKDDLEREKIKDDLEREKIKDDLEREKICLQILYNTPINSVIPLVIYQAWHSDILPNSVKSSIENIKNNNPEFAHYLFNETKCRNFIKENFSKDVLYAYDTLIPHAFKVDLWRYCVLYINGGIYLDIKYNCINDFKFIYLTDKEYYCNDIKASGSGIYNALIICKPKNEIMLKCINKVVEHVLTSYYGSNGLAVCGPLMMIDLLPKDIINSIVLNHTCEVVKNETLFYICYYNSRILQIDKNYRKEQKNVDKHWYEYYTEKQIYLKKYSVLNYHNNITYYFALHDNCIISNKIKKGNLWEKYMHDIFEKYITNDSIVIEGGCHIGTHTLKIASLCKYLYAFEPLPQSNKLLDYNLRTNNIDNVSLYQEGLSDKIGETEFDWISLGNPGSAGLKNNPMGTFNVSTNDIIKVKLITIDNLKLEKLDFIKLDVEGYEPLAINGGLNTIEKYKPIITLECWSSHNGTFCIEYTKDLFSNLINIGYNVIQIDNGPDFLFLPT